MNIFEFFNYILQPFGLEGFVLNGAELTAIFNSATSDKWQMLLNPSVIFTSILVFGVAFALWQILFVFPFRLVKKLIGFRSRKSVER